MSFRRPRPPGAGRRAAAASLLFLAAALVGALGPLSVGRAAGSAVTFHVVANSDAPGDQALKLRVRDALAEAVFPLLAPAASPEEAEELVRRHRRDILRVAQAELRRAGSAAPVRLEFGARGARRTVRLVIGDGAGHNWFCVLYPPLCLSVRDEGVPEAARRAFRLAVAPSAEGVVSADELPLEVRSALLDWWRSARSRLAARGLLGLVPR